MHEVPSAEDHAGLNARSGEGLATLAQHHRAPISSNVTFHQVLDRGHMYLLASDHGGQCKNSKWQRLSEICLRHHCQAYRGVCTHLVYHICQQALDLIILQSLVLSLTTQTNGSCKFLHGNSRLS